MIRRGIGAAAAYGHCVGSLMARTSVACRGFTAPGFTPISALTVAPIQAMIKDSGFQSTFFIRSRSGRDHLILAFFLFAPKRDRSRRVQNANVSRPAQLPADRVIRHPILLADVFMFVIVGRRRLMVTANLSRSRSTGNSTTSRHPDVDDHDDGDVPATIDRILNGLTVRSSAGSPNDRP